MREITSQKNVEAYLRKCLRGDFGPKFFLAALNYTTDRGYGKAAQPMEHSGPNGKPIEVKGDLAGLSVAELLARRAELLAEEEEE